MGAITSLMTLPGFTIDQKMKSVSCSSTAFSLHRTQQLSKTVSGVNSVTRKTLIDFLRKEEAKKIMLDWWKMSKRTACVMLAMKRGSANWSSLERLKHEEDIVRHHSCEAMPMRLVELAEEIHKAVV